MYYAIIVIKKKNDFLKINRNRLLVCKENRKIFKHPHPSRNPEIASAIFVFYKFLFATNCCSFSVKQKKKKVFLIFQRNFRE